MADHDRPRPRPTPFPSAPPVSFDKPAAAPPGAQPADHPPPPGYGAPPPAYPPQYGYGGYGGQPWGRPMSNGLGLTSMILGIIAIPGAFFFVGIVPGILAVIFGLIGRGKARRGEADNGGQALAGLICGIVGIVLFIAWVVILVVAVHHATTCEQSSFNDPNCYSND